MSDEDQTILDEETTKTKNCNTLIRLRWTCPEQGIRKTAWFTTNNKAMSFARKEKIADEAHFEQVDVPKKKVDICEWLNQNLD